MKINYASYTSLKQIAVLNFDLIICASGFETRSTSFYSSFYNLNKKATRKICFSFSDRHLISKEANDMFFAQNGFEVIQLNNQDLNETIDIYKEIFSKFEQKDLTIWIDYSCMTKILYAALVKYLSLSQGMSDKIMVYFVYTPAMYSEPPTTKSNLHNQPIPLFPTVELTDKKIALLLSLGYEEGKAQGLIEYLQIDTADIYLFFTSKTSNEKFYEKVKEHNKYILSKISINNQFEYDLQNVTQIFNLVESISNYLISKSYRVIIAPIGPKIFSLISILLTLKYNDLTIFRVSSGIKGDALDRVADPDKDFIIIETSFSAHIEENESV